jgi:hypothetical protein
MAATQPVTDMIGTAGDRATRDNVKLVNQS